MSGLETDLRMANSKQSMQCRASESILAGLFWDIIHAGNFNYYMVEDFLQLYAGEDADDQVREAA